MLLISRVARRFGGQAIRELFHATGSNRLEFVVPVESFAVHVQDHGNGFGLC